MKNSARRPLLKTGLVLLAATFLPGCMGYQLGSMLPPDVRTVYVPTFINQTDEPLIETETTRAAMQEIQKDGSLKLARAPENADAILKVTLLEYNLNALSFDATKKTTANEYRLTMFASVVMTRRSSGQVIAENQKVKGEITFPISGDFSSSKQRALPLASQDLAHNLVEAIVEAWP
jgi:hypothetical protein